MPTPQELARTAEQYDEEQWFEFLDELDAVSRRRQRRAEEPAPPAAAERDAMAHWMARKHLVSDSGIREIWYLPQGSPPDEIRLLEVNDRLALSDAEAARVEPIEFGLAGQDTRLKLLVAERFRRPTRRHQGGPSGPAPGLGTERKHHLGPAGVNEHQRLFLVQARSGFAVFELLRKQPAVASC
jgi:hypothetical protein